MRVLITYGSERGGTAGIAETLAAQLTGLGYDTDVRPATSPAEVEDYDAVVVGGALYANRWHGDARRFVRHHRQALSQRPVWLFSSGPLDDSATTSTIPPVGQVRHLMDRIGARGHRTFGGALDEHPSGWIASKMAATMAGDWRDDEQIAAWAHEIAAALRPTEVPAD